MIALGAVASAFGAVVFMVHPLTSQAKSSLVTPLQVQPFLIGDIVTTVSKARDQSASANDIQARSALNSFAGILLRYPTIKTVFLFHNFGIFSVGFVHDHFAAFSSATRSSSPFKPCCSASPALACLLVCALRFSRAFSIFLKHLPTVYLRRCLVLSCSKKPLFSTTLRCV